MDLRAGRITVALLSEDSLLSCVLLVGFFGHRGRTVLVAQAICGRATLAYKLCCATINQCVLVWHVIDA